MSKIYIVMYRVEFGKVIGSTSVEKVFKNRKRAVKYIFDAYAWTDKTVTYVPGKNEYCSVDGDVKTIRYVKEFIIE